MSKGGLFRVTGMPSTAVAPRSASGRREQSRPVPAGACAHPVAAGSAARAAH